MDKKAFKPYVPADSELKELTVRAMVLGVLMALVLGTANAYVGMKAGLTVSAIFPAAVVAMAALRIMGGTILEENIARTTASVGEALVAGAIFTIPAFIMAEVWTELNYFLSAAIMLIGGLLGVLFVIILRRSLVTESEDLPFPESVAAAEIVKAGQGGQTDAKYVFYSMGIAAIWELFKNSRGIQFVQDSAKTFTTMAQSKIELLGTKISYSGGFFFESPAASPALVGVGFIVGMRVSAVLFAGAVLGWMFLVPAGVYLNPALTEMAAANSWLAVAEEVWFRQIRPLAVGTMIVAAFYTLYSMRTTLITGITKAISDIAKSREHSDEVSRLEIDIDFKKIVIAIIALAIPLYFLYLHFSSSFGGSVVLTVLMIILGFFFAAVAGYLVGVVGSSNNPISGLTLSSLLIAAVLMVMIGVTGLPGIAAVLGVAGVVCCAAGISGDMMQDLKVGHILGGTPWKMETGEIIGVIIASLLLAFPMQWMHNAYTIGSPQLPAPQAGLMALMAKGIVGGEMAWPLVIAGMFLAVGLILINSPSPMLIAVGMYLPFSATAAIFVGGLIKWLLDKSLEKEKIDSAGKDQAENTGILISSGLIAGEALMAVVLALIFGVLDYYEAGFQLRDFGAENPSAWAGLLAFIALGWFLVKIPLQRAKGS